MLLKSSLCIHFATWKKEKSASTKDKLLIKACPLLPPCPLILPPSQSFSSLSKTSPLNSDIASSVEHDLPFCGREGKQGRNREDKEEIRKGGEIQEAQAAFHFRCAARRCFPGSGRLCSFPLERPI